MGDEVDCMNSWLFTEAELTECRETVNRKARIELATKPPQRSQAEGDSTNGDNNILSSQPLLLPIEHFASDYNPKNIIVNCDTTVDEWKSHIEKGETALLSSDDELLLVQFYTGKIPSLIGPLAQVPRLRRDVKVSATACLLFRRFFLSNSVMIFDPKTIMVASAFLASKVEDATVDIRYLEEGTKLMQAPVTIPDIITAEVQLLSGINAELMCFHPYKSVLAYTEDLRTYLKSEKGRKLAFMTNPDGTKRPVSGEDLRPIHDEARRIVDDVCVSDIPLLYSPGQIGLAAMMVANEEKKQQTTVTTIPQIDFYRYIGHRFESHSEDRVINVTKQMNHLRSMLKDLRNGAYGCGNHGIDMGKLKCIHKKLKQCRAWGLPQDGKKKKKKKKRPAAAMQDPAQEIGNSLPNE